MRDRPGNRPQGRPHEHGQANRPLNRNDVQHRIHSYPRSSPHAHDHHHVHNHSVDQYWTNNKRHIYDRIRREHPGYQGYFNNNFFDHHHYHPYYEGRGNLWWRGAGWGAINSWLPYAYASPVYYDDYGQPTVVNIVNTANTLPPPQPVQTTASNQEAQEWLPLGVFFAAKTVQEVPFSNFIVQLAVNKDGEIAGTYYNTATDQTQLLQGSVDPKTQEAAWVIADNGSSPLMTTGIYNLTQDKTPVMVHFPNGTLQSWVFVRFDPDEDS